MSAAVILLVWSSRTTTWLGDGARGVDVIIVPRERDETPRPRQRPPQAGAPQASDIAMGAREAADAAALANMIACMRPLSERPAHCPRDPPVNPDDPGAQLPAGGDYYVPPAPNLDRIYTQAERETLVMPSCVRDGPPSTGGAGVSVCAPFGTTPPPPSRSAEQICRDANMGGPCETPPFREEDVVRRRHSQ